MKTKKSFLIGLEVATPIVLILLWWILTRNSQSLFNPPMPLIWQSFVDNWLGQRLVTDFLPSLSRMLAGYGLAILIGGGAGILLGLSYIARRLAGPVVSFLRSIPGAALLPPAVLLLGVGHSMKVAIICFVCIWPILLNTIDGIDETHSTMTSTAKVFQINRAKRFLWVTLPAASPRIFAGMRTSLALAIIMLVISEMIASTGGLGYFILQSQRTFDVADMWSGIILLGILGYLLTLLFTAVERAVLGWYFESKSHS